LDLNHTVDSSVDISWVEKFVEATSRDADIPADAKTLNQLAEMTNTSRSTLLGRLAKNIRDGILQKKKIIIDGHIENVYWPVSKKE